MRPASGPASSAPCAIASTAKAMAVSERKLSPPTRSGCVGTRRNSMRDTCHRKRAQINNRKYQRHSRNWKIGRLTQPYHSPAQRGFDPPAEGIAYQVLVSRAKYWRQMTRMPIAIHEGNEQHLGKNRVAQPECRRERGLELRHRGLRDQFRSRNRCGRGRMRRCTTNSATINNGSAPGSGCEPPRPSGMGRTRRRPTGALPERKAPGAAARPAATMTTMRWRTNPNASSAKCARRRSWKSGPPRTSEKSDGSAGFLKPSPDTDMRGFTLVSPASQRLLLLWSTFVG